MGREEEEEGRKGTGLGEKVGLKVRFRRRDGGQVTRLENATEMWEDPGEEPQ